MDHPWIVDLRSNSHAVTISFCDIFRCDFHAILSAKGWWVIHQ
jgi:hypothetical protein